MQGFFNLAKEQMVSFSNDISNFGTMHIFNPEVQKNGLFSFNILHRYWTFLG